MNAFPALSDTLRRMQGRALLVGLAVLGLTALGALLDVEQFYRSYLFAFLFWAGLTVGCLALLLLVLLTRGGWGQSIRKLLEAGSKNLPLAALLLLPVAFGLRILYPWARPEEVAGDHQLEHRVHIWLNPTFFWIRAAIYFAAWVGLAWLIRLWVQRYEATGDKQLKRKLALLGGPGLVIYAVTVTFASLDWASSLEPHWFSTMYGMQFMASQVLTALVFAVALLGTLAQSAPFDRAIDRGLARDLGNLIFALVMVWAYLAFSQFLIIWSGNLPEEVPWYEHRTAHGWQAIAVLLIVFHFAVPFLVLLSRKAKDNVGLLSKIALGIFLMRVVDYYWLIVPAFHPDGLTLSWMDATAWLGMGGVWLALFLRFFLEGSPLPEREGRFEELLQPEDGA